MGMRGKGRKKKKRKMERCIGGLKKKSLWGIARRPVDGELKKAGKPGLNVIRFPS